MSLSWKKSSYSKDWNQALCVEVAVAHSGDRLVRDSKNPDGCALRLPANSWSEFISWIGSV